MKLHLSRLLVTVILFVACVTLVLLAQDGPAQACQDGTGYGREIRVVFGPLRIRSAPAGEIIGVLAVGETFFMGEQVEAGDYLWARHARGWSALHTLDCSIVYTEATGAVGAAPAAAAPPGDNKCYTEWDFCNSGSEAENAYYWMLGWCVAALERGVVSASLSVCMGGEEETVSVPSSSSPSPSPSQQPQPTPQPTLTPQPTFTSQPTSTPTPQPTSTPQPSLTPTPWPTDTIG